MSNVDLFGSLFGDGGLKTKPVETNVEDLTQFKPRFQKGQNERYEAIIRFLPNPVDPINKSKIHKWTVFLKQPNSPQGRSIDSLRSVNENCPLSQMYFNLIKSQNESVKKLAANFKNNERFYSLVQVIENQAEPQTVGKIMVWCYGSKIHTKIQEEERPIMQGVEPNHPFDLFTGRLFKVVAVKGPSGFNDLDGSKFFDIQYPANCMRMFITNPDPTTGQNVTNTVVATKELATTPEGQQQIFNYLNDNAPKLANYEFKPWDEDTKKYVNEMILAYSQIADGQPYAPQQANAVGQQMVMNQSTTPMQAVNIQQPVIPTQMVNPNPVPNMVVPTSTPASIPTPQPVSMPTIGLSSVSPAQTTAPSVPDMGGISGVNVSNLNSIMDSPVSAPSPVAAGNISDILSGVMAS